MPKFEVRESLILNPTMFQSQLFAAEELFADANVEYRYFVNLEWTDECIVSVWTSDIDEDDEISVSILTSKSSSLKKENFSLRGLHPRLHGLPLIATNSSCWAETSADDKWACVIVLVRGTKNDASFRVSVNSKK